MSPALDQLDKKTRGLAEGELAEGELVITALAGRSKQAMIVTDRRILMVKPGALAGAWVGPKTASFPLTAITAINVHAGRGIVALELVIDAKPRTAKADLTTAYQQPNWLPCPPSIATSPVIRELRAYVESDGRSRSARAELSAFTAE